MAWFSGRDRGFGSESLRGILLGSLFFAGTACSPNNGSTEAASGAANSAGVGNGNAAGSVNGAGAGNSAGAGSSAGAGNPGNAAGAGGSAGSDAASDEKFGQVVVYGFVFGTTRELSAEFKEAQSSTCERTTYGDCYVTDDCRNADSQTTYVSAGTVRVTSSDPALDVSIDPDSNVYPRKPLGVTLGGDEMLHFEASGGTVPAFSGDRIVPRLLEIDEPVADSTGLINAPTTDDLVINFSRGADDIRLWVQGTQNGRTLNCIASTTSSLTVPAAALAAVGSGVALRTLTVGSSYVEISGWKIALVTAAEAMTKDHKAAVKIQVQ